MPVAYLTRRVSFAAAHRYRRPDWSDERNRQVFGACANPNFHGHLYRCELTVRAPIDDTTGMSMDLGELDRALEREVVSTFDHRNINLEVPEFGEGKLIPTCENLARVIFDRLQRALGQKGTITAVVVREDDSLWAEYRGPEG
ncbi:MAG TPA: 6-carboxytetrahydropterin synthase [Gemmatimonadaceae bacterium]|nr:6-carboxytetrahydropterin synthase [Gemmatimonadaceae bacterium]